MSVLVVLPRDEVLGFMMKLTLYVVYKRTYQKVTWIITTQGQPRHYETLPRSEFSYSGGYSWHLY